MDVRAICPACARPASSREKDVCLYCGAPLQPVVTGTTKAAGTGDPTSVAPRNLRPLPEGKDPWGPATLPPWAKAVPERHPVRDFLSWPGVRLTIWLTVIVGSILFLGSFIESWQHHRPRPPAPRSR